MYKRQILYGVANHSAAIDGLDTWLGWWQVALNVSLIVLAALSAICSILYILSWANRNKQDKIKVI